MSFSWDSLKILLTTDATEAPYLSNKHTRLAQEVTIALREIYSSRPLIYLLNLLITCLQVRFESVPPKNLISLWLVKICDEFTEKIIIVLLSLFVRNDGDGAVSD